MIIAAWVLLIIVVLLASIAIAAHIGGYFPIMVGIALLLALYILTACTLTEAPPEDTTIKCSTNQWNDTLKVWMDYPAQCSVDSVRLGLGTPAARVGR